MSPAGTSVTEPACPFDRKAVLDSLADVVKMATTGLTTGIGVGWCSAGACELTPRAGGKLPHLPAKLHVQRLQRNRGLLKGQRANCLVFSLDNVNLGTWTSVKCHGCQHELIRQMTRIRRTNRQQPIHHAHRFYTAQQSLHAKPVQCLSLRRRKYHPSFV